MTFLSVRTKILEFYNNDFVKKFSAVFILDVLSKGITYLLIPIFLVVMPQKEFGLYTYIYFIIFSFHNVLKLGFDTALSKMFFEVSNRGKLLFTLISSVLLIYFILLLFCLVSNTDIFVLNYLLGNVEQMLILRVSFWVYALFLVIYIFLNIYFQLIENIKIFQIYNLIKIVATNGLAIALIYYLHVQSQSAIVRLCIESVFSLVIFLPLIIILVKNLTFSFDRDILKKAASVGLPMLGSVIAGLFYTISDKYFLQKSTNFETLAIYNLALLLMTPLSLIISSINLIWLPRFFKEKSIEKNIVESKRMMKNIAVIFLLIFLLILFVIFAGLKFNLLDAKYTLVLYILPIIFLSSLFDNLSNFLTSIIIKINKTIFLLIVTIVSSATTFFSNMHFIPLYGIYAAATILFTISLLRFCSSYQYIIFYKNKI